MGGMWGPPSVRTVKMWRKRNHLYCLDSMGQPLAIGLGLAVGLADRPGGEKVVVVQGDGSLLTGFSAMATVGHLKPRNLMVLVLDNGVYLAVSGQPTAARDTDFSTVARACGWAAARDVASNTEGLDRSAGLGRERRRTAPAAHSGQHRPAADRLLPGGPGGAGAPSSRTGWEKAPIGGTRAWRCRGTAPLFRRRSSRRSCA